MIEENPSCYLERARELKRLLKKLLKRLQKKNERQEAELRESGKAHWYRQMADSLLALSDGVPRGSSSARVKNVHTQVEETISLNPKFDSRGNAELLYKKARKAQRGGAINERKAAQTGELIASVEEVLQSSDALLSAPAVAEDEAVKLLCNRMEKILVDHSPEKVPSIKSGADFTGKPVPYRHFSQGTWDLYVGKNDAQNDELTTRFARHNDLWLHVAGHAGSHVVLRRPDKTMPVPPEVLTVAASLAVWFSKAKHTSYAEVHYTEARFVHKRRHSPPGEVMLDRYKSIRVSPKSPQDIFPSQYGRE